MLTLPLSSSFTQQEILSAGGGYAVGLKRYGTVVAAGWNEAGQGDVGNWTDIVSVSAGAYHTVGLKSDGTVLATGITSAEKAPFRIGKTLWLYQPEDRPYGGLEVGAER